MKSKDYISGEQLECFKAVQKINDEIYNRVGWDYNNTCKLRQGVHVLPYNKK